MNDMKYFGSWHFHSPIDLRQAYKAEKICSLAEREGCGNTLQIELY